jgi:hypothetical protein
VNLRQSRPNRPFPSLCRRMMHNPRSSSWMRVGASSSGRWGRPTHSRSNAGSTTSRCAPDRSTRRKPWSSVTRIGRRYGSMRRHFRRRFLSRQPRKRTSTTSWLRMTIARTSIGTWERVARSSSSLATGRGPVRDAPPASASSDPRCRFLRRPVSRSSRSEAVSQRRLRTLPRSRRPT